MSGIGFFPLSQLKWKESLADIFFPFFCEGRYYYNTKLWGFLALDKENHSGNNPIITLPGLIAFLTTHGR